MEKFKNAEMKCTLLSNMQEQLKESFSIAIFCAFT